MKKTYEISEELLNATLQYIGSKPYQEVSALINALYGEIRAQQPQVPTSDTSKVEPVVEKKK